MKLKNVIKYLNNINKKLSKNISNENIKTIDLNLNLIKHSINKKKNVDLFNLLNNDSNYTYDHFILVFTKYIIYKIVSNNNSIDYTLILNQLHNETQFEIINNANEIIQKMGLNNIPIPTNNIPIPTNNIPNPIPTNITNPIPTNITNPIPTNIPTSAFNSFDSFDIIQEINKYINSFTLDELLEKPDFILDNPKFNVSANKVTNIIDKTHAGNIFIDDDDDLDYDLDYDRDRDRDRDRDYIKKNSDNKKLSGIEIFNQKKIFYDTMTKFISNELLNNKPEIIFNFQYLVNNFFNNFVKKYIERKNLSEDYILFVYKGGTTIKIIYEKYKQLFKAPKLFKDSENNFLRSDSDYSLFIKKEENKNSIKDKDEYNKIYYDMFIMCYNILHKINIFINKSLYSQYLLPLEFVNQTNIFGVINTMNQNLKDLVYFKDIDKFIGITINDKTYMQENIPDEFDIYYLTSPNSNVNSNSGLNNKKFKDTNAKRKDFYITWLQENDIGSGRKIGYVNDANNTFQSINDNIYFINDAKKITNFSLHRIKLNTIIYFKTKNGKYGKMNCPSEIIDVSLGSWSDSKSFIDLQKSIKTYTYKNSMNKEVIFNSYTIYGFIEDLFKQLFIEVDLIWTAPKYDKKIKRMILLLCIYLYNIKPKDELEKILKKFVTDINNIKNQPNNSSTANNNTFLQEILNKFNKIQRIKKNEFDTNEFIKLLNLFITDINLFITDLNSLNKDINTGYSDVPESVPYLKKYLKYKQKYLDLSLIHI
jgi:hypothetical protein